MEANSSTILQEKTTAMEWEFAEFRITRITLYVVILILSCVGNSLVALVIVRARGMRSSSNLLIFNLAVCDFITPALSIPFDLAFEDSNYVWTFGEALCKTLWPSQTVFSTSSTLTLAAISLDRFRILAKPLTGHISVGKTVFFVLIIHTFSIGLCVPYFIVLNYNASDKSCGETWVSLRHRQAYTILLFLCQYALPLTTMTVAYILIYHSLHSSLTSLSSMNPERREQGSRSRNRASKLCKNSMEFKRKEQNIHLAKMFVIVIVVFAISMFPNQVLWLWVDFGHGAENKYYHYISVVSRIFTYANSVLNPFIYALKSREFRSGFAKIGRKTLMQPLRKISFETRKYARKVSANIMDGERPSHDFKQASAFKVHSSLDYCETLEAPLTEPIPTFPITKAKCQFEGKQTVLRGKFACYDIGNVREVGSRSDLAKAAPSFKACAINLGCQKNNGIAVPKDVKGIAIEAAKTPERKDGINLSNLETDVTSSPIGFIELPETDC